MKELSIKTFGIIISINYTCFGYTACKIEGKMSPLRSLLNNSSRRTQMLGDHRKQGLFKLDQRDEIMFCFVWMEMVSIIIINTFTFSLDGNYDPCSIILNTTSSVRLQL